MFISLVVVSAYSTIPQLEPIRKQIESLKSGMGVSDLYVGEIGEIDGLAITLDRVNYTKCYDFKVGLTAKGTDRMGTECAPEGAAFLFINIKIKNVGKVEKQIPRWVIMRVFEEYNDITLYYANTEMKKHRLQPFEHQFNPKYSESGYIGGSIRLYPGVSTEGWIAFEVPKGIELEDTTLEIKGRTWRLG